MNKTDFHMKDFALGLALKQRRKATRKSHSHLAQFWIVARGRVGLGGSLFFLLFFSFFKSFFFRVRLGFETFVSSFSVLRGCPSRWCDLRKKTSNPPPPHPKKGEGWEGRGCSGSANVLGTSFGRGDLGSSEKQDGRSKVRFTKIL